MTDAPHVVYGGIFGRVKQQMDDAAEQVEESGDDVGFVTETLDVIPPDVLETTTFTTGA